MKYRLLILLLILIALIAPGCRTKPEELTKDYNRPLLPGQNALVKITDPYQIPDFTLASFDLANLKQAVANSINYMNKPSSKTFYPVQEITHDRVLKSLESFQELLDAGLTGPELNAAIREKFDVYMSIGCDNYGTVLFTGYYTPIFNGSKTRTEKFKYPLYKQPADLLKGKNGQILGRKTADGRITQYPPRSVIENSNMLDGNELLYLSDPFEAYIAHVQGSVKIRMPDGKVSTVGYAASNGHDYKSISNKLVEDGWIKKSQLSLSAMIDYFKLHPELVRVYTHLNPRYVFFMNQKSDPRGSLNEPVIKMRSIATDKSIFPRASLTFISTTLPQDVAGQITNKVFSSFTLDQDTGGAIRAPGRCDIYMGTGDQAGKLAGGVYQEGTLYYLFLKEN